MVALEDILPILDACPLTLNPMNYTKEACHADQNIKMHPFWILPVLSGIH